MVVTFLYQNIPKNLFIFISYECACHAGYQMDEDDATNKTCKASFDLQCATIQCLEINGFKYCRAKIEDLTKAECFCPNGMELIDSENCQVRNSVYISIV